MSAAGGPVLPERPPFPFRGERGPRRALSVSRDAPRRERCLSVPPPRVPDGGVRCPPDSGDGRMPGDVSRPCVWAELELLQKDLGGGSDSGGTSQTCSDDEETDCEPCHITLEERLLKTHPIWFLPDLQRTGAMHLLQGKEEGNFIVRKSSNPDTMAISVRLPPHKEVHVQHYLVEIHRNPPNGGVAKYSLESSDNLFDSPHKLIAFYSSCCDELPVQLKLPQKVMEARTRHDLASIALLGQEFWRTAMASPVSTVKSGDGFGSCGLSSPRPVSMSFSSFGKAGIHNGSSSTNLLLSPDALRTVEPNSPFALTPPATSEGATLPLSADRSALNLNLSSLDDILQEQPSFSSFRSNPTTPVSSFKPSPPPRGSPPATVGHQTRPSLVSGPLKERPSPPLRHSPPSVQCIEERSAEQGASRAPTPPLRWSKNCIATTAASSITVTTTLTLNVNQVQGLPLTVGEDSQSDRETAEPPCNLPVEIQVSSLEIKPNKLVSPVVSTFQNNNNNNSVVAGIMNCNRDCLKLDIKSRVSPQSTPCTPSTLTPATPLATPVSEGAPRVKLRRSKKDKRRHSNHYHEANIIDSIQCYHSSLADKISDYEDLWSNPAKDSPVDTGAQELRVPPLKMSTFKPRNEISKSLGDLSELHCNGRPVIFDLDKENENAGAFNYNVDSGDSNRKVSSPFYVEPADALKEARRRGSIRKASGKIGSKASNRYSDSNIQWRSQQSRQMEKIESDDDADASQRSSSNENLSNGRHFDAENNKLNLHHISNENFRRHSRASAKSRPVVPPRIDYSSPNFMNGLTRGTSEAPWRIDRSWEFNRICPKEERRQEGRFPVVSHAVDEDFVVPGVKTVHEIIAEKYAHLLPQDRCTDSMRSHLMRVSEYDNLGAQGCAVRGPHCTVTSSSDPSLQKTGSVEHPFARKVSLQYCSSSVSDSGTEFSEPWDSRKWDCILEAVNVNSRKYRRSFPPCDMSEESLAGPHSALDADSALQDAEDSDERTGCNSDADDSVESMRRNSSGRLDAHVVVEENLRNKILSPQILALRHQQDAESGALIRSYAMDLGNDQSTTFSRAVSHFITCTLESTERDPLKIIRNVRQFMSGMKNYLVRSGEKEFEAIVKKECSNLKQTEFLNLDEILEDVLVRLVLKPLWDHINTLFIEAYVNNGSIEVLASNMKFASSQPYVRLGIKPELTPPSGPMFEAIGTLLKKMQLVFAPREKLAYLLHTVSYIYHTMYGSGKNNIESLVAGDADDLVPVIMWVLSHLNLVSAEIEVDYMTGLLPASSATEEADYYLKAFHSAIHALKNLSPSPDSSPGNSLDSVKQDASVVSDQGTMKILVPDEKNGSIVTRTLPVRPGMTTREICKMMAHKMKVTNPQDYGLYKLVDGHESILADNEFPHKVRMDLTNHGFHCLIAFKRMDAKIAWPFIK